MANGGANAGEVGKHEIQEADAEQNEKSEGDDLPAREQHTRHLLLVLELWADPISFFPPRHLLPAHPLAQIPS